MTAATTGPTGLTGRPILVVGVTQRSGTNFLAAMLGLHPDVAAPRNIHEDYLPVGAGPLLDGVRRIADRYPADWIDAVAAEQALAERVGGALVAWLADDAGITDGSARLLTKTPGAYHLQAYLRLVPDADVVLLVRDGRDVVASGMAGLGWSFDEGVSRWVLGAQEILSVTGRPLPLGVRVRLVRFEDLVGDLDATLPPLLAWLGLDLDRYDLQEARNLPVVGSSFARGGADEVHWDPVNRPQGFDPRGRAGDWPPRRHARFTVRAGIELDALGYPVADLSPVRAARAVGIETLGRLRRIAGKA